ncbi:hypothetical protein [Sneathiella sp.]|jgi:hypothetical protein|uniref:hypothetical protein n=1 Tax=Sneathiella sp. TaxID=1964365 RepID=UPI0039E380BD
MRWFGLYGVFLLALSGCAGNQPVINPGSFIAQYGLTPPAPDAFVYCSDHDCLSKTSISLSSREWQGIISPLKGGARTPAKEREALAVSVGNFETVVAKRAGTSADRARTGMRNSQQLDCIDESLNTTVFLMMVSAEGLLDFHDLEGTAGRGGAFDWPHFSSTIRERKTNMTYAVDSWFRDSGQRADIIPLSQWKAGWNPPDFK